jgi:hypothetical protein
MKVPIAGGTPTQLASAQFTSPGDESSLALAATRLYWTNWTDTVAATPIVGGASAQLGSGQGQPSGIAVDATDVYWVNWLPGAVMKAAVGGGAPVQLVNDAGYKPQGIAVSPTSIYWTHRHASGGGSIMMSAK